jgi:hypothetical protein
MSTLQLLSHQGALRPLPPVSLNQLLPAGNPTRNDNFLITSPMDLVRLLPSLDLNGLDRLRGSSMSSNRNQKRTRACIILHFTEKPLLGQWAVRDFVYRSFSCLDLSIFVDHFKAMPKEQQKYIQFQPTISGKPIPPSPVHFGNSLLLESEFRRDRLSWGIPSISEITRIPSMTVSYHQFEALEAFLLHLLSPCPKLTCLIV